MNCYYCKKKLNIIMASIKCKCNNIFCKKHRHPENHQCTYNYKLAAMQQITKKLPVVKARKMEYI